MKKVKIYNLAGDFCENKDVAKKIRNDYLLPALAEEDSVELDFANVTGVTQSFVHALVSEAIRRYPDTFYERVTFRNCSDLVQTVIEIVSEYMQESE